MREPVGQIRIEEQQSFEAESEVTRLQRCSVRVVQVRTEVEAVGLSVVRRLGDRYGQVGHDLGACAAPGGPGGGEPVVGERNGVRVEIAGGGVDGVDVA